jgi:hypothetical protein
MCFVNTSTKLGRSRHHNQAPNQGISWTVLATQLASRCGWGKSDIPVPAFWDMMQLKQMRNSSGSYFLILQNLSSYELLMSIKDRNKQFAYLFQVKYKAHLTLKCLSQHIHSCLSSMQNARVTLMQLFQDGNEIKLFLADTVLKCSSPYLS